MIELYEFALSGHCHKVRLLLSLLGIEYKSHVLNSAGGNHKTSEMLALNPFGQLPILKDGDAVIRDSQAILVYLARRYADDHWFPQDPLLAGHITAWLSTANNEIARGPNALRLHYKFGRAINMDEALQITTNLLNVLNSHLAGAEWMVGEKISLADVALYPYVALANEGRVELSEFVYLTTWLARIEALPGYISMPGIQRQELPTS